MTDPIESPDDFVETMRKCAYAEDGGPVGIDIDDAEALIRSRDAAIRAEALRRDDAGWFVLEEDDDGQRFWRGSSGPDAKDETVFDAGEPLTLATDGWPLGTRIVATCPALATKEPTDAKL